MGLVIRVIPTLIDWANLDLILLDFAPIFCQLEYESSLTHTDSVHKVFILYFSLGYVNEQNSEFDTQHLCFNTDPNKGDK